MKNALKVFICALIVYALFQNCEMETYTPRTDFKANLVVERLTCYPNDSISLIFELVPKDGNEPYSYQWILPDTLKGSGPFTVNLKEDMKIFVKITDAKSKQLDYTYIIKKDTIDSLKYDYRNQIIGNYICDFDEWYPVPLSSGWTQVRNKYRDTLFIHKSELFNTIVSGNYNELTYNRKIHRFTYEWGSVYSSVYAIKDSVFYGYSRLGRYTLAAKGKRLDN